MSHSRDFRVAIIGAGPSGFFATEALCKNLDAVSVDIFDRLPTPFGLVRFGVAPDHQKIKSVTKVYERTALKENVRFFGNVALGKDLSHADLKQHYDAIIYTVGASSDRSLGVAGEALEGSMSATEFVAWYNGHPDYETHIESITAEAVAVIGMGNVALDVTRILAKSVTELATSDITDHALEVLKDSKVKDIYMIGRRGPAQAKFTTKELRELGELLNANIVVSEADMQIDEASLASIENEPALKKNLEVMQGFAKQTQESKARRVHLRFLASPIEILGDTKVEAIKLEKNKLELSDSGYINAVGTGEFEVLPVQMVLRSVGYRGVALEGVPFNERRGVIPNDKGVVQDEQGNRVAGEYVAGWIKRGPSGVIGTNKADAMETVEQLIALEATEDLSEDDTKIPTAITDLLKAKNIHYVSFEDWLELDKLELAAGEQQGRPRVKFTNVQEMLKLVAKATK